MSITHSNFTFSHLHGVITEVAPEQIIVPGRYAGVKGEQHLIDQPKGRMLVCGYFISGQGTLEGLRGIIDTLNNQQGRLTGELQMNAPLFCEFGLCTFDGFYPSGAPFWDGSGVNGWCVEGQLRWRKRNT